MEFKLNQRVELISFSGSTLPNRTGHVVGFGQVFEDPLHFPPRQMVLVRLDKGEYLIKDANLADSFVSIMVADPSSLTAII